MKTIDRFWAKVNKTDTCWLWTAARVPTGYAQFWYNGKMRSAHRVAYELEVGIIPTGLQLDHLCRVRHCVNPKHLEPVTPKENVRRGTTGAFNKNKTHCPTGHPYSAENTSLYTKSVLYTGRRCLLCHKLAERIRRNK